MDAPKAQLRASTLSARWRAVAPLNRANRPKRRYDRTRRLKPRYGRPRK